MYDTKNVRFLWHTFLCKWNTAKALCHGLQLEREMWQNYAKIKVKAYKNHKKCHKNLHVRNFCITFASAIWKRETQRYICHKKRTFFVTYIFLFFCTKVSSAFFYVFHTQGGVKNSAKLTKEKSAAARQREPA